MRKSRGQNTVEYMLMLAMVVGVVAIAGMGLKKFMPQLFNGIANTIQSATGNLSQTGN